MPDSIKAMPDAEDHADNSAATAAAADDGLLATIDRETRDEQAHTDDAHAAGAHADDQNPDEMDALPPTPETPKTPPDVRITYVQAFNGKPLGTPSTLRMVEGMSVALLFQHVKHWKVTNGRQFSLTLGSRVWHYPRDQWQAFFGDPAVQDAIEANKGNALEVCIQVIFVSSPRPVESRE